MPSYFAYGLNLDFERMQEIYGKLPVPRPVCLPSARLVFDIHSFRHSSGGANLILRKGVEGVTPGHPSIVAESDRVEGVLYELTPKQFQILDYRVQKEIPNAESYQRICVRVFEPSGESHFAISYIANGSYASDRRSRNLNRPSLDYLTHLLRGNAWLSKSYYQMLLEIPIQDGGTVSDYIIENFLIEPITRLPADATVLSFKPACINLPHEENPEPGYLYSILSPNPKALQSFLSKDQSAIPLPILGLEVA